MFNTHTVIVQILTLNSSSSLIKLLVLVYKQKEDKNKLLITYCFKLMFNKGSFLFK